tara:strand:+ start:2383 stop:2658 length:276 start_codon:yes stop_codon:yes gene_type:complete
MNAKNSVINYCKFKNIQRRGFLKYGYFKRIIGYILDYYNDYYIRKIFLQLVEENFFIKKKNEKQSYLYQFNPTPKEPKIYIDPKKFIISWD